MIGSPRRHDVPPSAGRADPGGLGADPDSLLVARARTGDVEAFESLVRRHLHPVYRVARRSLAADVTVDEVVVDVFVRTWRDLAHGPTPIGFGTWILTATAQQCHEANSR